MIYQGVTPQGAQQVTQPQMNPSFNPMNPYQVPGMSGLGGAPGGTNQTPQSAQTQAVAPGSLSTPTGVSSLPQWAQSYFGARGNIQDQTYGQGALSQYMNWAKQYNTNSQGQTDYNFTPWAFRQNSFGNAISDPSNPNLGLGLGTSDQFANLAGGGFNPATYNLGQNVNLAWNPPSNGGVGGYDPSTSNAYQAALNNPNAWGSNGNSLGVLAANGGGSTQYNGFTGAQSPIQNVNGSYLGGIQYNSPGLRGT